MKPQVGHAYIVGVWVDKGDRDSTPPILDDCPLFSGKPPPSLSNFIPTHALIIIAYGVKLRIEISRLVMGGII